MTPVPITCGMAHPAMACPAPLIAATPAPRRQLRALLPVALALLTQAGLAVLPLARPPSALAASALLETVKQNPALARSLCDQFKKSNAAGQSAMGPESIASVAGSQGLSKVDAEILITYVIGMNCPDVR